jgi:hypothetical protein
VDRIAKPFTGDRDFELERAEAWNYISNNRMSTTDDGM